MIDFRYVQNDYDLDKELALADGNELGLDSETSADPNDSLSSALDPLTNKLCTVQSFNGSVATIFDVKNFSENGLRKIANFIEKPRKRKVMHNGKFDLQVFHDKLPIRNVGTVFDPMLASQLLTFGDVFSRKHNLKAVLKHFLKDVDVDKTEATSDWSKPLTREQMGYAWEDVTHLLELANVQTGQLRENGMIETAKIEFDAVEPVAMMEHTGFMLDVEKWTALLESNKKQQKIEENLVLDYLASSGGHLPGMYYFNIGSATQIIRELEAAGIEIPLVEDKKTGELKKSTSEDSLAFIADQHPAIQHIINYKTLKKAITSYGMNWIEILHHITKRIHASFWQIGTLTGRFSCTNPNLQQIPKDNLYRSCFIAPPGWTMVWADYSQMELRILAELSGDKNMYEAFISGKDLHTFTAAIVYNMLYEEIDKEGFNRRNAKDLNFGIVYGVGAARFAKKAGLSLNEAYEIIRRYKEETYPEANDFLTESAYMAKTRRQSRTFSGRLIKYKFDSNDSKAVSMAERNGKNSPIQGGNADITKLWMRKAFNELDIERAKQCNAVHDEGVWMVRNDYLYDAMPIIKRTGEEAGQVYMKRIPTVVDVKFGPCWAEVKD